MKRSCRVLSRGWTLLLFSWFLWRSLGCSILQCFLGICFSLEPKQHPATVIKASRQVIMLSFFKQMIFIPRLADHRQSVMEISPVGVAGSSTLGITDKISISELSDENFSEGEIEDLRMRVKDGLLKQPTVVIGIDGRKTREEWMLDHALRQVISKLDPDEQRRVRLLVKAFETVHPEHNEKSIKCYPFKGEGTNEIVLATSTNEVKEFCLKSQPKRSISIEQILRKQDTGTLFSSSDAFHERSPQENHDQLMSLADDTILQETFETAISKSTLDLSEDSSKLAFA